MTTIIKTPKHPLTVAKPTDPWEKVRAAADRCAEARKRAARVGQQVGFAFHAGSRAPTHADAHQAWDELYKATTEFKEICTAWLQLQAPLGNATYEPAPQGRKKAPSLGPKFPQEPPMSMPQSNVAAALWLWPEVKTRVLTSVCSMDIHGPFCRRFLIDRPANPLSKTWVGATNEHVLVLAAVAEDTQWPTAPGVPVPPMPLSPDLTGKIQKTIDGDTFRFTPVARGLGLGRVYQWAPNCYIRGEDIEGLVERGTIGGVHVNRRLVRTAVYVLGGAVDVFVDAMNKRVRIDGAGYQALIMGRNPAPEEVRGPELLA